MILTDRHIKDVMEKPLNGDNIAVGAKLHKNYKLHVTGEGYKGQLKQVAGYESDEDFSVRKQLTSPSTIQLTRAIIEALSKWTSTQGTVKNIGFKQEKDKEFKRVLDQAWRGQSLDRFMKTFYKEAQFIESGSFIVITKPKIVETSEGRYTEKEGILERYDGGNLDPYIIFVSLDDVTDYRVTGDKVEYLIWKVGDNQYRLIDDSRDAIITEGGEIISEIPNEIEYVPAIQVSGFTKDLVNDQVKASPIDHVTSMLDRYLSKDSDLVIQMVKHLYPKLAIVTSECTKCGGAGHIFDEDDTKINCKACDGSGKTIPISRGGVIGLPEFIDSQLAPYPGAPATYVSPETETITVARDDLVQLAKDIIFSATGDKNIITQTFETATEAVLNFKGLEDRMADIIDQVENREEFIVETIARMHNDYSEGFDSVSVRYGRRLTMREENAILQEIQDSKSAGMPVSHIENLQRELIYSKYRNNKVELTKNLLLADVEPLLGYTVSEVLTLREYIPEEDIILKVNFGTLVDKLDIDFNEFMPDSKWKDRVAAIREKMLDNVDIRTQGGEGNDN